MNPFWRIQFDHNKSSEARRDIFSRHRRQVTGLLSAGSFPGKSRLCVLGAGNANDLDLAALTLAHQEVHLVDLDAEALAAGVARQGLTGNPAVRCHGGLEVTGMLDHMSARTPDSIITDDQLRACEEEPCRQMSASLPGPFDVVASTCLLSQLMKSVVAAVGEGHPRFVELIQAIRAGHLRLLARFARPGGFGVLITDVVSSDSFPELDRLPEAALPGELARLARVHNFFHGVNPTVLASLFRSDPVLREEVAGLDTVPPWRWDIGPRRYLVMALRLRKRG